MIVIVIFLSSFFYTATHKKKLFSNYKPPIQEVNKTSNEDIDEGVEIVNFNHELLPKIITIHDNKVVLLNIDGSNKEEIATLEKLSTDGRGRRKVVAPNGKYFAFTEKWEKLFIARIDGSGEVLIPGNIDGSNDIKWSPDSKYLSWGFFGNSVVKYVDVTKEIAVINNIKGCSDYAWAQSSDAIVCSNRSVKQEPFLAIISENELNNAVVHSVVNFPKFYPRGDCIEIALIYSVGDIAVICTNNLIWSDWVYRSSFDIVKYKINSFFSVENTIKINNISLTGDVRELKVDPADKFIILFHTIENMNGGAGIPKITIINRETLELYSFKNSLQGTEVNFEMPEWYRPNDVDLKLTKITN